MYRVMLASLLGLMLAISMHACQSSTDNNAVNSKDNESQGLNAIQADSIDLAPAEFRQLIDKKKSQGVLLDVRTETERLKQGFLIDSRHLDFYRNDFNEQLDKLPKDKAYFVYCRSGQRSGQTVETLRRKGYKAYNLKGGFNAWKEAFPF